ncbi:MAG: tetratricopeptide repeat protein [Polyangiaceae bacterium]
MVRADSGSFDLRRGGLLAREPSSFVGRAPELRALHEKLRSPERLVALIGPRGIGKTRLALRYAASFGAQPEQWPGGVWFCDVRHASTLGAMSAIVLAAMSKEHASPRREIDPSAAERALLVDARALLVLDNVDQLAPEVGAVLERWRDAAPLLRFLVTSRVPIALSSRAATDAATITLGALDTSSSSRGRGDAVELFMARAGATDPYLALERRTAGSLVAELSGIPFAIELAAFAAKRQDPRALLERARDARARGAAKSAVEVGFSLLDDWARELLEQVSTFRGGFTLEAAARVIELPAGAPPIADALLALADKSLLELMRVDPLRFAMAESVRGHAEEQLRRSPRWLAVEWRHAHYFRELAITSSDPATAPSPAEAALERENFGALMEFGARMNRPELVLHAAVAVDAASQGGGLSRAELAALDGALGAGVDDADLIERALGVRAGALFAVGSLVESLGDAERALGMALRRKDRKRACAMHVLAGTTAFQAGELERAMDHLREAQRIATERGDRHMSVEVLYRIGSVELTLGRTADARANWERALALAVELCDGPGEARVSMGLGSYFFEAGDLEGARTFYERGERLSRALGMQRAHRVVIAYQAILLLELGDLARAETLLKRAVIASRQAGDGRIEGFNEGFRGAVLAARDRVDEAAAAFASADALSAPHPFQAELMDLLRAHLDLAEARSALRSSEWARVGFALARARGRAAVARAPNAGATALVDRSDDARIALRLIDRMLAEIDAQVG